MAVGDATIGYGGTIEINDGGGSSYVAVDAVITVGVASYTLGPVESKRLANDIVKKLPTIKKGDSFTIKQEFTNAGYIRMKALLDARTPKNFRFTIPDDDGDTEITVPGIVTQNKISDLDPEKITELDTMVEISDEEV
jgi:hypothetical protein